MAAVDHARKFFQFYWDRGASSRARGHHVIIFVMWSVIHWAAHAVQPAEVDSAHTRFVATLKQNVLQIRVHDSAGRLLSTGSAFVLDPEYAEAVRKPGERNHAYAVTNHHVIDGAAGAVAVRLSDGKELTVVLLGVLPGVDLALLRVDFSSDGAIPSGLRLSETLPLEGTEVWAIGYPLGLGFTINKGVASGIRACSQLPSRIKERFDPKSMWIQVDAPINSGNSGGPITDAEGRVYGVSTWSLNAGDSTNFASAAHHVRELIAASSADPIAFPTTRVRSPETRPAPEPPAVAPFLPDLTGIVVPVVAQDKLTIDLLLAAQQLLSVSRCGSCNGRGWVFGTQRIGERREGIMVFPVTRETRTTCSSCGGDGIGLTERIERAITSFARASVRTRTVDDQKGTRQRAIESALRQALIMQDREQMFILDQVLPPVGAIDTQLPAPVWFIARTVRSEFIDEPGGRKMRALLVEIQGSDRIVLLVDHLEGEAPKTDRMLVVGSCVAHLTTGADRVPILLRPFVVAF